MSVLIVAFGALVVLGGRCWQISAVGAALVALGVVAGALQ